MCPPSVSEGKVFSSEGRKPGACEFINFNFLGRVLRTRGWRKPKVGGKSHSKQSQVDFLDVHQGSSLGEISFLPPWLPCVLSPWDMCQEIPRTYRPTFQRECESLNTLHG